MIAMIFAAGLGTRLKPITDRLPKALVPVSGIPLLEIQIRKLYQTGVRKVIVNVHHFSQQIIDYIQSHPYKDMTFLISDESGNLLDTGGGLKKAVTLLDAEERRIPLLVHNVDILDNGDMAVFYQRCEPGVDALLMVSQRPTKRYFLFDGKNRLVGWTNIETGEVRTPFADFDVEKCRKLAFAGMHVVTEKVYEAMDSFPDKFSITDFYISQCASLNIKGYVQQDFQMVDVGKLDSLQHAEDFYNRYYRP